MNYLISVLKKLVVTSDFKTAKTKFLNQGIKESEIDSYFKKFKEARDRNKIDEPQLKNIDFWTNYTWKDFTNFIKIMDKTATKREVKQEPWKLGDVNGAEKIKETGEWVVYKINTYEASEKLGTRNWCIVRSEDLWKDYTKDSDFYFVLSKTKSYKIMGMDKDSDHILYDDIYHRIAVEVLHNGSVQYWDADNEVYSSLPIALPMTKDEFLKLET